MTARDTDSTEILTDFGRICTIENLNTYIFAEISFDLRQLQSVFRWLAELLQYKFDARRASKKIFFLLSVSSYTLYIHSFVYYKIFSLCVTVSIEHRAISPHTHTVHQPECTCTKNFAKRRRWRKKNADLNFVIFTESPMVHDGFLHFRTFGTLK